MSNSLRIRYSGSCLAAAVAERLVLHPAADLVDAAVGDPYDVERVSDTAGVIEVRGQAGAERLGQIGGHHLDPREPVRVARWWSIAAGQRQLLPSTMSITTCRSRSISPVA